jgi:methyl-accepting chemotaxis protein
VNQFVGQLDQMAHQNAALAEESAAAAASLRQQASQLGLLVSRFELGQGVAVRVGAVPAVSLPG